MFLASAILTGSLMRFAPKSALPPASPDFVNFYHPVAENLLDGNGLTRAGGEPAVRYPPGYPLFLAGVYATADAVGLERQRVVIPAIVVLHAGVATLLAVFASQLWSTKMFLLPAVLWTFYPLALFLIPTKVSELLYTLLLVASVLCFWTSIRNHRVRLAGLAVAGALLGLAGLCRPAMLPVPFLLIAVMALRPRGIEFKKRLAGAVVFLLACLVPIVPWEVWMYRQCGVLAPLSTGGFPSIINGLTWAKPSKSPLAVPTHVPSDVKAFIEDLLAERKKGSVSNLGELTVWLADRAIHEPGVCLKVLGYKVLRSWYATDSHRREGLALLIQVPILALGALGAVRSWRRGGYQREFTITAAVLVAGAWLMTTAVLSIARYMTPAVAFVFLLVPAAFCPGDIDE